MTYTLIWTEGAKRELAALGKAEYARIVRKAESHLIKDPVNLGKPLGGSLSGLYRYRVGDYRIVYKIVRNELIVLVMRVGHRREIYD